MKGNCSRTQSCCLGDIFEKRFLVLLLNILLLMTVDYLPPNYDKQTLDRTAECEARHDGIETRWLMLKEVFFFSFVLRLRISAQRPRGARNGWSCGEEKINRHYRYGKLYQSSRFIMITKKTLTLLIRETYELEKKDGTNGSSILAGMERVSIGNTRQLENRCEIWKKTMDFLFRRYLMDSKPSSFVRNSVRRFCRMDSIFIILTVDHIDENSLSMRTTIVSLIDSDHCAVGLIRLFLLFETEHVCSGRIIRRRKRKYASACSSSRSEASSKVFLHNKRAWKGGEEENGERKYEQFSSKFFFTYAHNVSTTKIHDNKWRTRGGKKIRRNIVGFSENDR